MTGADYRVGRRLRDHCPRDICCNTGSDGIAAVGRIGNGGAGFGQNLGMFIGPIRFGKLAESIGWAGAGYALIPVCAIGVIAVCLAKFR
jgi:hypothetical protein